MKNSICLMKNIIKRQTKQKKEFLLLLLLPLLSFSLISFVLSSNKTKPINISVINFDKGNLSENLIKQLESENAFTINKIQKENFDFNKDYGNQILIIPESFSKSIKDLEPKSLEIKYNLKDLNVQKLKATTEDIIKKFIIASKVSNVSEDEIIKNLDLLKNKAIEINYLDEIKKSSDDEVFITAMGFGIMFIMLLSFIVSQSIVYDKQNQIINRVKTFNFKGSQITLGYFLSSVFIGVLQVALLIIPINIIFKITKFEHLAGIFLVLCGLIIATSGVGILIFSISKKNINPLILVATIITPTSIFSGCFIPEKNLPDIVNKIGYLAPQKWVLKGIDSLIRNYNIELFLICVLVTVLFGIILSFLGGTILKKQYQ